MQRRRSGCGACPSCWPPRSGLATRCARTSWTSAGTAGCRAAGARCTGEVADEGHWSGRGRFAHANNFFLGAIRLTECSIHSLRLAPRHRCHERVGVVEPLLLAVHECSQPCALVAEQLRDAARRRQLPADLCILCGEPLGGGGEHSCHAPAVCRFLADVSGLPEYRGRLTAGGLAEAATARSPDPRRAPSHAVVVAPQDCRVASGGARTTRAAAVRPRLVHVWIGRSSLEGLPEGQDLGVVSKICLGRLVCTQGGPSHNPVVGARDALPPSPSQIHAVRGAAHARAAGAAPAARVRRRV